MAGSHFLTLISAIVLIPLSHTLTDVERLDNSRALFMEEGTLVLTNSYAHLLLNYQVPKLKQHVQAVMLVKTQLMEIKISATWPPGLNDRQRNRLSSRLRFVTKYITETTADIGARVNNLLVSIGSEPVSLDPADYHSQIIDGIASADRALNRPVRQIISAGIGLVTGLIGASVSSLFNFGTLSDIISGRQSVITHQVEDNILAINENTNAIVTLNKTVTGLAKSLLDQMYATESLQLESTLLTISSVVGIVSNNLHHVAHSVQKAQSGEIALDAIDANGLQKNLEILKQKTSSKGYQLTANTISDLNQCKASYIYSKRNATLSLILHIPIYIPNRELKLHKFLPTPILMKDNLPEAPVVYLSLNTPQMYLGLDPSRTTFVELSADDLALCQHHGQKFFCPHLSRLKAKAPSCVYNLYINNIDKIPKLCNAEYITLSFKVTRLTMSSWLISTTLEEELFITCPGEQPRKEKLRGTAIVSLDKGCTATSPSILIERPQWEPDIAYNSTFTSSSPIINTEMFTTQANITPSDIIALMNTTETRVKPNHVRQYKRFQSQIQQIEEQASPFNIQHLLTHGSTGTLTVIITITIIVVSALIYRKCFRKNGHNPWETTYWFSGRPQPQGDTLQQTVRLNDLPPYQEEDDPEINPRRPTTINPRRTATTPPTAVLSQSQEAPPTPAPLTSTQKIPADIAALAATIDPPTPSPRKVHYDVPPGGEPRPVVPPKPTDVQRTTAIPTGTRPKEIVPNAAPSTTNTATLPPGLLPYLN